MTTRLAWPKSETNVTFEFTKDGAVWRAILTRRRGWPWARYTEHAHVHLDGTQWRYTATGTEVKLGIIDDNDAALDRALGDKLNAERAPKEWVRVEELPRARLLKSGPS